MEPAGPRGRREAIHRYGLNELEGDEAREYEGAEVAGQREAASGVAGGELGRGGGAAPELPEEADAAGVAEGPRDGGVATLVVAVALLKFVVHFD